MVYFINHSITENNFQLPSELNDKLAGNKILRSKSFSFKLPLKRPPSHTDKHILHFYFCNNIVYVIISLSFSHCPINSMIIETAITLFASYSPRFVSDIE